MHFEQKDRACAETVLKMDHSGQKKKKMLYKSTKRRHSFFFYYWLLDLYAPLWPIIPYKLRGKKFIYLISVDHIKNMDFYSFLVFVFLVFGTTILFRINLI